MASTSASSIQKSFTYDVFLSFRGEDTRKTFVDHLYHALQQKGITTYKDDEKIEKGKRINDQLIGSIEDSRFYIIVFSKNYASSSWCLDELVKIMECQKMTEHTAYPIFYDVEPTQVRNQTGVVGEAFNKHIEEEGAGRWRDALKEAADLAGWDLKNTVDGHEAKFIQKIVIDISLKLSFINWSVDENLVGMETRVKDVVSSLEIDSDDVRMIGIKGMGGGGKTTLATAVFDHISIWFEGISFVENVREVSKGTLTGLKDLQKQVLLDVLNDKDIDVKSVSDGKKKIKKMMSSKKVLVVLDDVDDINQLEALAGKPSWFKAGSRIIITTRDEQVLVAHKANFIHDVNLLSHEEAIGLFSRYAFGEEIPIEGYEDLSRKVVHYAAGLPLTIKVLGSHLCGRTEREWVDALERLKTIPLKETLEKLELSYNGLENDHKEIFLDVACLLKGMEKKEAIRILESCGYHAEFGIRVLEQKSLLTISGFNILHMHDHLEEMGKNIVRRSHPDEPNKHNRLWIREEIVDILVNDLGTDAPRSIKMYNSDIIITKGLRKMEKLRNLYVYGGARKHMSDKVDQYLPDSLQSIHWTGYPFRCLPKTFQANKLVHLQMTSSKITQLWEGGEKKVLNKLKYLVLKYSSFRSFDMGTTPNLQIFELDRCDNFVELNMHAECLKLKILNLCGSKVSNLNIGLAPSLEKLNLIECKDLVELYIPVECPKLKFLRLCESKVSNLNIGSAPCLERLDLTKCNDLVELHMPVECPKLKFLELSESKVSNLNIGSAPCLERLNLTKCNDLVELHMPVKCPKLKFLELSESKVSNLNIGSVPCLEWLDLANCNYIVELHMPVECSMLKTLKLSGSKVTNLNIGLTPNVETLDLGGCNDFVELHMPIECLKLKTLDLSGSKVSNLNIGMTPNIETLYLSGSKVTNLNIGLTPNVETLDLGGCNEFVELYMSVECLKLKTLDLSGSKVSNLNIGMTPNIETLYLSGTKVSNLNIGVAPNIEMLDLERCNDFVELHMPVECLKLKILDLSGSKVSNLNIGMAPNIEALYLNASKVSNLNIGMTPNKTLDLGRCNDFVELHMPVECLKLKTLYLSGSKVINLNIGMAPNIETLDLGGCNDFVELHIPVECLKLKTLDLSGSKVSNLNIGMTPNIKDLDLGGCNDFVELQMPVECRELKFLNLSGSKMSNLNLGLTPHLKRLDLKNCYFLQEIHAHVGCLKKLVYLDLRGCSRFEYFWVIKGYKSSGFDSVAIMLKLTAESLDTCPLHPNSNLPKFWFKCLYDEDLSLSSGNLEKLISFGLCACTNLESFSASICGLQGLEKLTLKGSIPEVPNNLYLLESLEHLTLSMKEIRRLPDSICMLKHLKYLKLRYCHLLEQLPNDLGRLEGLEELHLTDCIFLRDIPNSVCNMKRLRHLDLRFCILVEKLPEEFGRLESLEELKIEGAGISHLPHSIFQLKDLYIVGSTWQLESYGFTSLKEISTYTASCYIKDSQH